jgi:hypothetical protein
MGSEIAEPTRAALTLLESSLSRLAEASLQLSRSRAWQDSLATVDHLATLLGAEVGRPEPVPVDADPAGIARLVTGWVESLLLPEYRESASPREARYRVRLPEEAHADGLGDLADFLESLALRLDLTVVTTSGQWRSHVMKYVANPKPARPVWRSIRPLLSDRP